MAQTLTEFQKTITKPDLMKICAFLHHTLTPAQLEGLKYYPQYTWIVVNFSVKGYGRISFGITNYKQSQLYGSNVGLSNVEQALKKGWIGYNIWRMVDDVIYAREHEALKVLQENYKLPSAEEFLEQYYRD